MKQETAKTAACILLGAESIGMMAAFIISVLTVDAWGNVQLSERALWATNYGFFVLAELTVLYGFVLRPLRRKAIKNFCPVNVRNWRVYGGEALFVVLFTFCAFLQWAWLSIGVLSVYSLWKLAEIVKDLSRLNNSNVCF